MRLLWLVPYCPWPADHGGKIRVWEILTRLAERGMRIDAWYPESADAGVPPKVPNLEWHPYPSRLGVGRLRKAASLVTPWPVSVRAVFDRRTRAHLLAIADQYDAVVIDQTYQAPMLSTLSPNVPLVAVAHNVEHRLMAQMAKAAPRLETRLVYQLDAKKLRRVEMALLSRADLVLTVSQDDLELLAETIPRDRLRVSPNGVDLDTYSFQAPQRGTGTRMLMTGMLGYPPNHEAALRIHREILPMVRSQIPDAQIELVGSRCPPELLALHDPASGFNVVGYVDDVMPYLRSADLFLMPLTMGGGTRLKALQAMACGIPIVSTSQGVEGVGLTPGVDVALAETGQGLAEECIQLLANSEARRGQALSARLVAEGHYGWESIVDAVQSHLNTLVQ